MEAAAKENGVGLATEAVGGMFGFVFTDTERVESFADISAADTEYFKRFFHAMLDRGVYLAPSAYEAGFISAAHSDADVDRTVELAADAMRALA